MKAELKKAIGENQPLEAESVVITLSYSETIEIRPTCPPVGRHNPMGGRMSQENASLKQLKASTRMPGIYPLAANTLNLFL
ncbi:hypothetical protein ACQPT2_05760 [Erwinia amylovora]